MQFEPETKKNYSMWNNKFYLQINYKEQMSYRCKRNSIIRKNDNKNNRL